MVRTAQALALCRKISVGATLPKKIPGKLKDVAVEKPAHTTAMPEIKMVLFPRFFVRNRMISLATTGLVAATSFAAAALQG